MKKFKSYICLIILFKLSLTVFSQDTLILNTKKVLVVKVLKKTETSLDYSYPNETLINTISINKVAEIHFSSGRVEKITLPAKKIPKVTLWFMPPQGYGHYNPDVNVLVDGKLVGNYKFQSGFQHIELLSSGKHQITITLGKRKKLDTPLHIQYERDYDLHFAHDKTWGRMKLDRINSIIWHR